MKRKVLFLVSVSLVLGFALMAHAAGPGPVGDQPEVKWAPGIVNTPMEATDIIEAYPNNVKDGKVGAPFMAAFHPKHKENTYVQYVKPEDVPAGLWATVYGDVFFIVGYPKEAGDFSIEFKAYQKENGTNVLKAWGKQEIALTVTTAPEVATAATTVEGPLQIKERPGIKGISGGESTNVGEMYFKPFMIEGGGNQVTWAASNGHWFDDGNGMLHCADDNRDPSRLIDGMYFVRMGRYGMLAGVPKTSCDNVELNISATKKLLTVAPGLAGKESTQIHRGVTTTPTGITTTGIENVKFNFAIR